MAQSVGCPTLDFDLGHDLRVVVSSSPASGAALSTKSAWDSLPEAAPHLPSVAEPELPESLSEPPLSCFPGAALGPRKTVFCPSFCFS